MKVNILTNEEKNSQAERTKLSPGQWEAGSSQTACWLLLCKLSAGLVILEGESLFSKAKQEPCVCGVVKGRESGWLRSDRSSHHAVSPHTSAAPDAGVRLTSQLMSPRSS